MADLSYIFYWVSIILAIIVVIILVIRTIQQLTGNDRQEVDKLDVILDKLEELPELIKDNSKIKPKPQPPSIKKDN